MKKLIIIGNISQYKTGPGDVLKSLLAGLEKMECEYSFINSFTDNICKKIGLYMKLFFLLFCRNKIINVHTFGYQVALIICLQSCINKTNRYYLTVHGIRTYENKINGLPNNRIDEYIEGIIYKKFPNIICVSNLLKNILERDFEPKCNLFVVNNGLLKYEDKTCKKNNVGFIYAGGYSILKNPLECIDIFKVGLKYFPKSFLIVCGAVKDKKLKEKFLSSIRNDNLDDKIKIYDKISGDSLLEQYKKATFIIAPSKLDTFNMTVLEGMNMGCIPIVSKNCGVKELISNQYGIVYDNMNDVKEKIRNINVFEASSLCHEVSLKNTYIEMTKRYLKIFGELNG